MTRLALIAAAGLILAGCGGGHTSTHPRPPHYPVVVHSPVVEPAKPPIDEGRLPTFVSPTRLAITTWGSSSCPSVPDELVFQSPHRIRIHLIVGSWDGGRPVARTPSGCTLDVGPTRMIVAIDPKLIDVHRPVTVIVFSNDSTKPLVRIAAPLRG